MSEKICEGTHHFCSDDLRGTCSICGGTNPIIADADRLELLADAMISAKTPCDLGKIFKPIADAALLREAAEALRNAKRINDDDR